MVRNSPMNFNQSGLLIFNANVSAFHTIQSIQYQSFLGY